ncbi:hypothetical protein AB0D45_27395 [Streptomyces sp. NPDC048352]|uniref:hypothetical protein n=1 Tax=Streptomyces sp. NPDC048352 TaxID=3154718 RepID=UPI00344168A4
MSNGTHRPVSELTATLVLAAVAMGAWAAWLGWDQHRDVQPDGSTTGPYQAWQVIGLGLTLLAPVYWAASRQYVVAAVLGTSAGLGAASLLDWSDDGSGLYVIGVGMVTVGSLLVTGVLSLAVSAWKRRA